MPSTGQADPFADEEVRCANCQQRLDVTDKFCRECGLPTVRRAETQRAVPAVPPPDTQEFRRALDGMPDPQPFVRASPDAPGGSDSGKELTTGSVLRVTSPTFATRAAMSTLFMIALILFLVGLGVLLLVLAVRS